MLNLIAIQDTYLKKTTKKHSSELPPSKKHFIEKGEAVAITNYKTVSGSDNIIADLAHGQGKWVVYTPHFKGYNNTTIDWTDFNTKISKYFTVGEACNFDKRRIPTSPRIQKNIIQLAKVLDDVREDYKNPILVNSWYRPILINRAIGSSDRSQHVQGLAADIRPSYGSIYKFQSWLDKHWSGALGYGAKKGFVHLDIRGLRTGDTCWKNPNSSAQRVRWNY